MEQDEPVCEMVTERKCRDVQGELVLVFVFAFVFVFVFAFAFVFVLLNISSPVPLSLPTDEEESRRRRQTGEEEVFPHHQNKYNYFHLIAHLIQCFQ